jgi:peptidyl-dipeptidase Dcp
MKNNPLLEDFNTPYESAPFDIIELEHYLPAFKAGIEEARKEIDKIAENTEAPTFENTIEALEFSGLKVERISSIFFNLNAAETNEKIQEVAREFSPKLSAFKNDVQLDEALFERIRTVWDQKDRLNLDAEQRTLLENTYLGFV